MNRVKSRYGRYCFGIGILVLILLIPIARGQLVESTDANQPPPGENSANAEGIRADVCTVQFISEPVLAFEEPGVLTRVPKEGDTIQEGDVISTLNDEEIELRILVADYNYQAAKKESENKIKVEYAEAQAKTSLADYMAGEESNRKVPGVVTEMEMRRRKLEYDSNRLAILNSKYELEVAKLTTMAKEKELEAAKVLRKRIQLRSPITGIVTRKERHVGEYVRAGDPVVKVGQLDRLRVSGRFATSDLKVEDAYNREVVVRVCVQRPTDFGSQNDAQYKTFRGRIEHVAASVDQDQKYIVWVEIENTDNFVVRPGMVATMTIVD